MAPGRPKKPPILAENIKVFIQNRGFLPPQGGGTPPLGGG